MQWRDTLRQVQEGSLVEQMAAACGIAPAEAGAALRGVMPELAWHVETAMLSRGGLADLVEALGRVDRAAYLAGGSLLLDEAARRDGEAILAQLLGTKDAGRMLAARAAGQCRVDADAIATMLPHLAVAAVGGLAGGCNARLAGVLAQVPPLGRLGRGSPHADLAAILRRRCGAGVYSPRALPRAVRRAIAGAAASPGRRAAAWYMRFLVGRRMGRLLRRVGLWQRGNDRLRPAGP
jgi:hypothetical protein